MRYELDRKNPYGLADDHHPIEFGLFFGRANFVRENVPITLLQVYEGLEPMKTKPQHEVAYQDLVSLAAKHKDELTSLELLAVAANMLGKLLALQDQRVVTPERAMQIIIGNIRLGNQQVVDQLRNNTAGSA